MPLFIYRCQTCDNGFEEFFHNRNDGDICACPVCGGEGKKCLQPGKYKIRTGDFFEPYWEEDFGPEPVFIHSREHLFKEARERGFNLRRMPEKLK